VWCARNLVGNEPFAVLLADDLILAKTPCLKQMIDAHAGVGGNVIAVMDVVREHVSRYGIVKSGRDDGRLVEVQGLVEKPAADKAPSNIAVIGRYILEPSVFEHLGRQNRGAGGEIQLTDAMATLIGRSPFHGLRFEGKRFDCGDKVGFFEANLAFALARQDLGGDVRGILKNYV
jgi:UTP--glucose-1-phosphate uridylyltransferase